MKEIFKIDTSKIKRGITFSGEIPETLSNTDIKNITCLHSKNDCLLNSCMYCGYGGNIMTIIELHNGMFLLLKKWKACLTYSDGSTEYTMYDEKPTEKTLLEEEKIEVANSLDDIFLMCLTESERNEVKHFSIFQNKNN